MIVRCASCHREERWEGAERAVLMPGGARRPDGPPPLAAWRALREARGGGGAVLGACPTCGQPLVGERGESVPFTVSTPKGDLVVGATITGPAGVLDEAAADAFVTAQFPRALVTRQDAVGTLMVVPMLGVPMLWGVGVLVVLTFMMGSLGRIGLVYPILIAVSLFIGVTAWFSRRNER